MKLKQLRNYIAVIAILSLLTACGASKTASSGSATSSSRGNPETGDSGSSTDGTSTIAVLTECSEIDSGGIAGEMTTYYSTAGQFVETYIRMNITTATAAMTDDADSYVQIYRWHADASGNRVVNEDPTKIYFVERYTGRIINISSPAYHLSGSTISDMIANYNLTGITASNFYERYLLVLGDIGLTYDAISIATYDASTNEALSTEDVLLPAFAADPNDYMTNHAIILHPLHPNYSERNGGFTDEQYKQRAELACQI